MTLVSLDRVRAGYGDFEALHGVSVSVREGETLAIVGANGAGKSTLLKVIAGLVRPTEGDVSYEQRQLDGASAHDRVADGISLVPEGRRIFPSLSVRENLLVGAYSRRSGPWNADRVVELFPMLGDRMDRLGSQLSGGEQQAVAIARALMANPTLLLLDEVSLGLAPIVVKQLYAELPKIRAEGITTLIVEQDVRQALDSADRVVCMLEGRVSLEGPADEVRMDEIKRAYFGM